MRIESADTYLTDESSVVSESLFPLEETRYLFEDFDLEKPLPDTYNLNTFLRLRRDHRVSGPLGIRASGVINRPCYVVPGGSSAQDLAAAELAKTVFLGDDDTPQSGLLDRFANPMLQSGTLLGFSVGELIWGKDGRHTVITDVRVRDSRSFRFGRSRLAVDGKANRSKPVASHLGHNLLWRPFSDQTREPQTLPHRKFFVYTFGTLQGNPYGVGLGNLLWWLTKLKRDSLKFWLIYVDKFGSPTVYGRVTNNDDYTEEELRAVEQQLLAFTGAIRRGTHGVCPAGTDIKMLEAIRSGSGNHKELIDYFDRAITEVILGSIHLGDSQGLSGAPANSDELVRKEIAQADADLFHSYLNNGPVRWLTELNYPNANPPQIWRDFRNKEGREEKLRQDEGLYKIGYRLKPEAVVERYGDHYEQTSPIPPSFSEGFYHHETPPLSPDDLEAVSGAKTTRSAAFQDYLERLRSSRFS